MTSYQSSRGIGANGVEFWAASNGPCPEVHLNLLVYSYVNYGAGWPQVDRSWYQVPATQCLTLFSRDLVPNAWCQALVRGTIALIMCHMQATPFVT